MVALAAHEIILNVANSAAPYTLDGTGYNDNADATDANIFSVIGAKDVTISGSGDVLDTTAFLDGSYRTKLVGLIDGTMSFSGNFETGTDVGTASDFLAKLPAGTQCWFFVGYVPTTATPKIGLLPTGFIESFEITGAVDGLIEYSCSVALTTDPDEVLYANGPIVVTS